MKENILIIETDEISTEIIISAAKSLGIEAHSTNSVKGALGQMANINFNAIFVSMNFPDVDIPKLISLFLSNTTYSELILITEDVTGSNARALIQNRVNEFLTKPLQIKKVIERIKNALSRSQDLQTIQDTEIENKSVYLPPDENTFNRCIDHLHTVLNQGAGFGAITTLIDLLESVAEKDGDSLKIPLEIMPTLKKNAETSTKILETIKEIHSLRVNPLDVRDISFSKFFELLENAVELSNEILKIKNQSINIIPDNDKNERVLKINPRWFYSIIQEIIANSAKFSDAEKTILLEVNSTSEMVTITFKNSVSTYHFGKIKTLKNPIEIAFEPFYRLTSSVTEEYGTPEIGLGLYKVRQVMKKHGGVCNFRAIHESSEVTTSLRFPVF